MLALEVTRDIREILAARQNTNRSPDRPRACCPGFGLSLPDICFRNLALTATLVGLKHERPLC